MSTTRAVTALAALIHESQQRRATAYGVARDVDSAGMLMSPETAAELERLRARVGEVERAYVYDTAALKQRVAELKAERSDRHDDVAGALGYSGTEWDDLISIAAANTARVAELARENAALKTALGVAAEQRHLLEPQDAFLAAGVARLRAEVNAPDEAPHVAPCRWPASPDCTCGPIASGGGR